MDRLTDGTELVAIDIEVRLTDGLPHTLKGLTIV